MVRSEGLQRSFPPRLRPWAGGALREQLVHPSTRGPTKDSRTRGFPVAMRRRGQGAVGCCSLCTCPGTAGGKGGPASSRAPLTVATPQSLLPLGEGERGGVRRESGLRRVGWASPLCGRGCRLRSQRGAHAGLSGSRWVHTLEFQVTGVGARAGLLVTLGVHIGASR